MFYETTPDAIFYEEGEYSTVVLSWNLDLVAFNGNHLEFKPTNVGKPSHLDVLRYPLILPSNKN